MPQANWGLTITRREQALRRLNEFGIRIEHQWVFPTPYLEYIIAVAEMFKDQESFKGLKIRRGSAKTREGKIAGGLFVSHSATSPELGPGTIIMGWSNFLAPHRFLNTLVHEWAHAWAHTHPKELARIQKTMWRDDGEPISGAAFVSPYALMTRGESFAEIVRVYGLYPQWLSSQRSSPGWNRTVRRLSEHVFRHTLGSQPSLLKDPLEFVLPGTTFMTAILLIHMVLLFTTPVVELRIGLSAF